MTRLLTWSLTFLACFALQVPWVQCVASCHERLHPDVGHDHCHVTSCDTTETGDSRGATEPAHSDLDHVAVSFESGVLLQAPVLVADVSPCPDISSAGPDESHGSRAALRRDAEPDSRARLSAVLLL